MKVFLSLLVALLLSLSCSKASEGSPLLGNNHTFIQSGANIFLKEYDILLFAFNKVNIRPLYHFSIGRYINEKETMSLELFFFFNSFHVKSNINMFAPNILFRYYAINYEDLIDVGFHLGVTAPFPKFGEGGKIYPIGISIINTTDIGLGINFNLLKNVSIVNSIHILNIIYNSVEIYNFLSLKVKF